MVALTAAVVLISKQACVIVKFVVLTPIEPIAIIVLLTNPF